MTGKMAVRTLTDNSMFVSSIFLSPSKILW
nr:MAG TPA: hypothetical protein [Caudoviricetes sp.]